MKIALREDVFMSDVGNERAGCSMEFLVSWHWEGVMVDVYGSIDND